MLNTIDSTIQVTEIPEVFSPEIASAVFNELSNAFEAPVNFSNLDNFVPALERIFRTIKSSKLKNIVAIAILISTGGIVSAQDNVKKAISTVNGLRVRTAPSLTADVVAYLSQGQVVDILSESESGDWAEINFEGDAAADGFVSTKYLETDSIENTKTIPDSKNVTTFSGGSCQVINGTYENSKNKLCVADYKGAIILYAHNFTAPGKKIVNLFFSPAGTEVDIKVNGVDYGKYKSVKSYEISGQAIPALLTPEALGSQNNEYITLVTTNKDKENTDPYARRIVLLQKVG